MLSKHTRTRLLQREGKRVRAHRWIMEQHLGRKLLSDEEVHHINHNPLDNRIENLEVINRGKHIDLHAAEKSRYPKTKICGRCGREFIANPRKRKRQKCCWGKCAQEIRVEAALKARSA